MSRRARVAIACRGCMAGCGAWVATRCWVGVRVGGCRGVTIVVVDGRSRSSNQREGTLLSSRLPICPLSPPSWCGGRDQQTWSRTGDPATVGRTPQRTGGTPLPAVWALPLAGEGPLRAHHRPGLIVARATVAGTAVPVHRTPALRRAGPPENTRPPRLRPFGPQTEQKSLLLTDKER